MSWPMGLYQDSEDDGSEEKKERKGRMLKNALQFNIVYTLLSKVKVQ